MLEKVKKEKEKDKDVDKDVIKILAFILLSPYYSYIINIHYVLHCRI